MGRLDRYIGAALLKGWLLVWLVMSAIFSLLGFVDELERTSDLYRISDAVEFILRHTLEALGIGRLGQTAGIPSQRRLGQVPCVRRRVDVRIVDLLCDVPGQLDDHLPGAGLAGLGFLALVSKLLYMDWPEGIFKLPWPLG